VKNLDVVISGRSGLARLRESVKLRRAHMQIRHTPSWCIHLLEAPLEQEGTINSMCLLHKIVAHDDAHTYSQEKTKPITKMKCMKHRNADLRSGIPDKTVPHTRSFT
jgi:hypothetical protein